MAVQFRNNQIADYQIRPVKIASGFNLSAHVDIQNIKSDATQSGSPPASQSLHDVWIADTWGGGYTDGHYYELTATGPDVWTDLGAVASGDKVLVQAGAGPGGSFAGHPNDIGVWDGSAWSFTDPEDGMVVMTANRGSNYFDQSVSMWSGSSWDLMARAGQELAGSGITYNSSTRKLDVSGTEIGQTYLDYANVYSDKDQSGADPTKVGTTANPVLWIVNNWLNQTDDDVVLDDGATFTVVGTVSAGNKILACITQAPEAGSSFAGKGGYVFVCTTPPDTWDSGTAPSQAQIAYVKEGPTATYKWDRLTLMYSGSSWATGLSARWPNAITGDGLSFSTDTFQMSIDYVHYEDALTQGEADNDRWELAGQVATIVAASAVITRNGQKMKKTATNPPPNDGEWYWDSGNKYVIFKDGYLELGDEMSIWSLET